MRAAVDLEFQRAALGRVFFWGASVERKLSKVALGPVGIGQREYCGREGA